MKALTVDFELVIQSMRDLSRESNDYFLDRNSGKVIGLSRSLIRALEQNEEHSMLPEWDTQMIPLARAIVLQGSPEYVRIPEAFGCPEHRWMSEFTAGVRAPKLKSRLLFALRGRGSCKRFKEFLKEHPEEMRRWTAHRQLRWQEKIQDWLEQFGVLAINGNPPRSRAAA